jgi:oligo-1,6-glucosidase
MKWMISILLCLLLFSCKQTNKTAQSKLSNNPAFANVPNRQWWKEAIIYQLYPRSFKDSDGDGLGDIKGIIEKLDYIKDLGVTAVWINPIFESPNVDNGYDVSEYTKILKSFGTMEDFDLMLKGFHERGIRVVLDLVVNHSSNQHPWFVQSRSSTTNKYRNYYHWWPASKGKPNKRPSLFDVSGDAWQYDSATSAYYLHTFAEEQPDLNWENPDLRNEVYDIMHFWFKKGVDGFRMDAFQFASKDINFPPIPEPYDKNAFPYVTHGPYLHDYIQEMNKKVLSQYDVLTVAEGAGDGPADAMKFTDERRNEFSMAYHFENIDLDYINTPYRQKDPNGVNILKFKQQYSKWDSVFAEHGWNSIYLANHDQPRMVSHWGNDDSVYREKSTNLLNTFILTMRGTPYCYYGDELGMSNIYFTDISQYDDIAVKNKYQQLKNENKVDLAGYVKSLQKSARDNARTPLQWDNSNQAGFTNGKPWLPVNANYSYLNVQTQTTNPQSPLNYFKKLTALRNGSPALIYGAYQWYLQAHPQVYVYTRSYSGESYLVLLNMSNNPAAINTAGILADYKNKQAFINNYFNNFVLTDNTSLAPWQAVIIKQ